MTSPFECTPTEAEIIAGLRAENVSRSVLDLFSAAAGGWSLGMHRAGFHTVAACEAIDWRRTLYSENNPGVPVYDDVRTLTAARLLADLGTLPRIVVGSPPCQDISSANTKGKGVEGERSGLFFEAVRIIGEVRPRWFALENSANLRTRGADAVLAALEALGYACWAFVVGADDIGANHERKRSWLIGYDPEQLDAHAYDEGELRRGFHAEMGDLQAVADHLGRPETANAPGERRDAWAGLPGQDERHELADASGDATQDGCRQGFPGRRAGATAGPEQSACRHALDAAGIGHEGGRPRRHGPDGDGQAPVAEGHDADAAQERPEGFPMRSRLCGEGEITERPDVPARPEMGICPPDRGAAFGSGADWSLADLAGHLRLDVGLPAWLAGTRVAVGGPRGTAAASLIVEAFGDAVLPQIPEAIGRAILRVEAALAAIYGAAPQRATHLEIDRDFARRATSKDLARRIDELECELAEARNPTPGA